MTDVEGTIRPISIQDLERFPELCPIVDAWRSAGNKHLCDLESGPLHRYAGDLCLLEEIDNAEFRYLHYGANVGGGSGISMVGKTTADFTIGIGSVLRDSYHRALSEGEVLYSVNKSVASHLTHSWQRVILPLPGHGGLPNKVIALVRPLVAVDEILNTVGANAGFFGGTLEPIVGNGRIQDFVLLPMTPLPETPGHSAPKTLSALLGRKLCEDDLIQISQARLGSQAFSEELQDSQDRFGRVFVTRIVGGRSQQVFSLFDVTDLVAAQHAAEEQRQAMKDFAEIGSDWMWETDADHNMSWITEAVERATGNPVGHYIGRNRLEFAKRRENADEFVQHIADLEGRRPFRDLDYAVEGADGQVRWIRVSGMPRFSEDGEFLGYRGTGSNITAEVEAKRALEELAYFDPLTGLGNRAFFTRELSALFNQHTKTIRSDSVSPQKQGGLMLLDLDHFKEVNDTLGHAAGDQLLRRVADKLRRCAGSGCIVCRLGGDEFAIIVPNVESEAHLGALATQINAEFSGTVRLNEGAVHIATSIGVVLFPQQTSHPDEAMRFADLALYRAKESGRSRWLLFETEFDDEVQDRVSLARDLRQAVQQGDLEAHFQLQADLTTNQILGFEALARWTHPTRGPVPPSRFIPIAESSHLIGDIGDWMLNEVCRQGREWLDAGGVPVEMSVNLSVAQLWHRHIENDIIEALARHDFPAELLCIELTESVFEDEAMPRIERLLQRLKRLGVRLALDDFGTGYSSMQYLSRLSFDKLKIDRSFVQSCHSSPDQRRLLQGMVGLGKGLGMQVIVEGVENKDEFEVVRGLGCDAVQGFYFAEPMAFHDAALTATQVAAQFSLKPFAELTSNQENVCDELQKITSGADQNLDILSKKRA